MPEQHGRDAPEGLPDDHRLQRPFVVFVQQLVDAEFAKVVGDPDCKVTQRIGSLTCAECKCPPQPFVKSELATLTCADNQAVIALTQKGQAFIDGISQGGPNSRAGYVVVGKRKARMSHFGETEGGYWSPLVVECELNAKGKQLAETDPVNDFVPPGAFRSGDVKFTYKSKAWTAELHTPRTTTREVLPSMVR